MVCLSRPSSRVQLIRKTSIWTKYPTVLKNDKSKIEQNSTEMATNGHTKNGMSQSDCVVTDQPVRTALRSELALTRI